MHYLGIALYAEGPTDYYFLRPLLQRLCEDICLRESPHSVEVWRGARSDSRNGNVGHLGR